MGTGGCSGNDRAGVFVKFGQCTDPFALLFKGQVKEIHGVDLDAPPGRCRCWWQIRPVGPLKNRERTLESPLPRFNVPETGGSMRGHQPELSPRVVIAERKTIDQFFA
jgi:hypothetical protein